MRLELKTWQVFILPVPNPKRWDIPSYSLTLPPGSVVELIGGRVVRLANGMRVKLSADCRARVSRHRPLTRPIDSRKPTNQDGGTLRLRERIGQ